MKGEGVYKTVIASEPEMERAVREALEEEGREDLLTASNARDILERRVLGARFRLREDHSEEGQPD